MWHRIVPAIEDVRRKMDDFIGKNDLLDQVEYSTDDIVNAMAWPVAKFNELPPRLCRYRFTLMNFPYYDSRLTGTACELLRISVFHLTRNKLLSAHGGIQNPSSHSLWALNFEGAMVLHGFDKPCYTIIGRVSAGGGTVC
jgi:hypothetical protein